MASEAMKIKKEHMHQSANGIAGFHIVDVSMETYKSRFCYYRDWTIIQQLSDDIKKARKDQKKSMVQFPKHLSDRFQGVIWSFD